ncbi:MAG: DMT family transporter [Alphaproteobacteria bacterium]
MPSISTTLRGILTAFLGFALFSSHDSLIKALGGTYSVFQLIFFINLFSFIPMTITMLVDRRVDNFRPHHPWLILIRSCLMILAMTSAFYAFAVLPLTQVYALLFATPLLVTILSVPLLGETVRAQRWAAVAVGLVGVIVVLRPGYTELTLGHLAALTAAFASAFASIVIRKIGSEERSAVLILYPLILSVAIMGSMLPLVYEPVKLNHLAMMAAIALLSVFAQHCIIGAYRVAAAALIAPLQYSQIIWASIFGILFFAEKPDTFVLAGSSIIIASGLFVVWRESRTEVSARTPVLKTPNLRFDTGTSPKPKHRKEQS